MKEDAIAEETVDADIAASDMTITAPGKRRHGFYVTPEGAAPATTSRYAPLVESPRAGDELDATRTRLTTVGVLLFVVGLAVTVGSYALASADGGGGFVIGTGPMIAGIALMLRGSR